MFSQFSNDYKNVFNSNPIAVINRFIFLTLYGFFKYLPTPIGDILRVVYLKLFLKKLNTIFIREGVTFHFPENISIGKSVIGEYVYLNGYGEIEIGNDVLVGANTMLFSHEHNFKDLNVLIRNQGLEKKKIIIKDNVYIGCNVSILGGVTISSGAIIGAGSVVNKDVLENEIVGGVPAKVIGRR